METKNNDKLLLIATFIMMLMGAVMYYQNKTLNKYRELLEQTDTTTISVVDTLYLEKTVTDTVPQFINQTIYKTDTVFKKEGDSISVQPMLITLKKKKLVE